MAQVQYWILIIGLVVVALTLNITLCEWMYKGSIAPGRALIAWDHGPDVQVSPRFIARVTTGITVASGIPKPIAAIFGVTLPTAMLFAAAFLVIAARQSRRRAVGQCLACGHQLAGSTVCPECGVSADT